MPLCEQLNNIIENSNIKTVFQPIISLRDGTILGHEALSRGPENTIFHNPEMMFTVAEKCGASWDLELLCRSKALESSVVQKATAKLFLNVNPNIIISPHNANEICENILDSFDNNVKKYYNKEDLEKGYIETKNRHGLDEKFPIISLSIAGVTNTTREFTDKYILSEYIGMIKKRCKQIPCSVHIIE